MARDGQRIHRKVGAPWRLDRALRVVLEPFPTPAQRGPEDFRQRVDPRVPGLDIAVDDLLRDDRVDGARNQRADGNDARHSR